MERRYPGTRSSSAPQTWPGGVRRVWAECELREVERERTLEAAKRRIRFRARGIALALPLLVLASMAFVFHQLAEVGGPRAGYFAAFLFYWGFWGLLVPRLLLGREVMIRLFRPGRRSLRELGTLGRAALVAPPLVAAFTVFPSAMSGITAPVLLAALTLAIVNGTTEEVLWRGVYARLFPDTPWLGFVYPATGFALWHLAPQVVHPFTGFAALLAFVLAAQAVGLCYGWVAWRTGSIRATIVSHIILDFVGLGALVYLR